MATSPLLTSRSLRLHRR